MPKRKTTRKRTVTLKSLIAPKRRTTTRRKTRGRGLRGAGIRDWFKKAYSWTKDKVSSLWDNNKGMLQQQALRLANQAKDKALEYAREKKILSSTINKILPGKFGIDKIASSYVASKTGMGRKRRVGRPRKYGGISYLALQQQLARKRRPLTLNGSGFFGDLWSGVKDIGKIALPYVMPKVLPKVLPKLLGVGKRRKTTTRRRKIRGRGILGSLFSQYLPF